MDGLRWTKTPAINHSFSRVFYQINVTVQPAPFVKPHCVLIMAVATVLLIYRRSAHRSDRERKLCKHNFLSRYSPMAELLQINMKFTGKS